jgi:hypothetical protein
MPAIDLRDDDGGESIRIGEYFAIHYKPLIKRGEFQTKGEAFTIQHIRSPGHKSNDTKSCWRVTVAKSCQSH